MLTQIWSARADIISGDLALLLHYWPGKLKFGIKIPGDIILLRMYTINQDHMHPWYDVWFNRENYFVILANFLSFYPLTAQKMKILKMKKNPGDIIILHKCTKSHDHPLYCSGDVAWDGCNCYFSFWAIFCPFNHLTNWKKKLSKKNKKKNNNNNNNDNNNNNNLEISFYTSVPKIMVICYTGPEIYGAWQM